MGFEVLDANGAQKVTLGQSVFTLTTTGNVDDLDFGNADLIRLNNASLTTLRGLKAGSDGQRVTIVSIGAGEVDLAHQNTGSAAANRLINTVTSGVTPMSAGVGSSIFQYDATTARWRLIKHEQGAWLTIPFSAGDFTGGGTMTVTVGSTNAITDRFRIVGKTIHYQFFIHGITLGGGASNAIFRLIPNGYTVTSPNGARTGSGGPMRVLDNGTYRVGFCFAYNPDGGGGSSTKMEFTIIDLSNFSNPSTNTDLFGNLEFEVD